MYRSEGLIMNRKKIKIGAAVVCGLLLGGVSAGGALLYSSITMDLQKTCVAKRDLPPRTKITEDDIEVVRVPGAYLASGTYHEVSEVVGMYTEIQGKIPAGSPFYRSMLFEESQLPDYPASQLKAGQSAYTLETDLAKSGGGISAGQRVDLYLTIEKQNEAPITGCLFEHVRIISLRDHQGLETTDAESTGIPYLAVIAVDQDDLDILTAADTIGTIRMIAGASSYDTGREAVLTDDPVLLAGIRDPEN